MILCLQSNWSDIGVVQNEKTNGRPPQWYSVYNPIGLSLVLSNSSSARTTSNWLGNADLFDFYLINGEFVYHVSSSCQFSMSLKTGTHWLRHLFFSLTWVLFDSFFFRSWTLITNECPLPTLYSRFVPLQRNLWPKHRTLRLLVNSSPHIVLKLAAVSEVLWPRLNISFFHVQD